MTSVQSQIAQVAEFMKVGGQAINVVPTIVSYAAAQLRYSLILEEITGRNEFQYCAERDDLIGALDGMCDILYVTYGAALTFGAEIAYTKPANSIAAGKLAPANVTHNTINTLIYNLNLFTDGYKSGRFNNIEESLTWIVRSVFDYAEKINVDLAGAFNEVHASNMSKFSESKDHAINSAATRLFTGDEKYRNVHPEEVTVDGVTYWMIKRDEDGKILKSLNFFEPDLSKFVK